MDSSETISDAENHEDKNSLIEQLKFEAVAKLLNSVELRAKYRLGLKGRLSRAKTLQVYSQIFEPNIPIVDILNATGGVPATGLDADSNVMSESEEECLAVGDNDDTHEEFEPINSAFATLGSVGASNVCSKKNTVVNIASKTSSDSLQEVTQTSVVIDDLQKKPIFESQSVSHSATVNVCPESNLGEFSDDLRILTSQSVNLRNEQDADINSSVSKGNNLPKTVLHGISESLNSAAIEQVFTSRAEGVSLNVPWQECDEHNSLADAALSLDNSSQRALTKSSIKQQLERRRKEALRKRLDEAKKSKQRRYNEAPQAQLRSANKNRNLRVAKLLKEQKSVARAAAAVHASSSGKRKRVIKELQNQEENKQGEAKQRRRKAKLTMNDNAEHSRMKKKRLSAELTNFNATEHEAASNSTTLASSTSFSSIVDSSAHGEAHSHSSGLLHFAEMCSQKQKGDAPGLNFLPFRKQFPLLNAGLDVCESREESIDVTSTNDAIVCFSCELVDAERAVSALQLQIKMKRSKCRKESITSQPVFADTGKTSNVQASDETASGLCSDVIAMVASDVAVVVMADVDDDEPLGVANEISVFSVNSAAVTSCTKDMSSHLTQVCEPPSAIHSSTDNETAVEHDSVDTTSLVAEDIPKVAKTAEAALCDVDKDVSEMDSNISMLEKEDVDSASGILTSFSNSTVDIVETAPVVTESMSTEPTILDIAEGEGCDQSETVVNDNESSHIVASDDTVVDPTSRPSQSQHAADVINTGHSAAVDNEGVEMTDEGGREPGRRSVSDLWRRCQGDMADIRRRTEEISRQNCEILEELRRMEQAFSRLYEVLVNSSLIAGSRRHDYSNNEVFAGDGSSSSSSREILVTRQQPATFSSPDSLSQLPPLSLYAGDRRSIEREPKLNCSLPAHSKGSSHSLHSKERESSLPNEEALDLTMPSPKQSGIQPPPKQIGYILPTCQQPTLSENSLQGIASQMSEDVEDLDINAQVTGDNGAATLVDDDTMSVHTITLPLKDSSDGLLMPAVEMSEVGPDMGNFMISASRFEYDENEKSRQATFVFEDGVSKNNSTSSSSVRGFSSENTVIDLTASSLSTSAANLSVTTTLHNFVPLSFSPAATSVTTTVATSKASSSAAVAVAATHHRTARDSPQTSKGQGHHRSHASISGAGPSTTAQHPPISRVSTDRRSEPHHSRNSITPRPQVIVCISSQVHLLIMLFH